MFKLRYIVITFFLFMASACYEVNEEIVINKDGSGTYLTKMDMGALVQMMQTMATEEELSRNGLDRLIDTVIPMKKIMDSAKGASEEQRRLFSGGTMKLQMNMKENLFKTAINFPFKSFGDLQTLMAGSSTGGMADIFKNLLAGADSSGEAPPMQNQGIDQINNIFDVTVTDKLISRKLNKAKYDSLMMKPELAQAKQMMGGGFEIPYTTTIRLPRPVKSSNNDIIKLSADKKTVTIKYDLLKLFDTPEKFSYAIQY